VRQLQSDIQKLKRMAIKRGLKPVVRLNGTSDLRWELIAPELFTNNADTMFYDYTKWPLEKRAKLPSNYHLTYSASEKTTATDMYQALLRGNVSVVVSDEAKKVRMLQDNKLQALDGDTTDLRFLDPASNYIILLRAKGRALKDITGFVI